MTYGDNRGSFLKRIFHITNNNFSVHRINSLFLLSYFAVKLQCMENQHKERILCCTYGFRPSYKEPLLDKGHNS